MTEPYPKSGLAWDTYKRKMRLGSLNELNMSRMTLLALEFPRGRGIEGTICMGNQFLDRVWMFLVEKEFGLTLERHQVRGVRRSLVAFSCRELVQFRGPQRLSRFNLLGTLGSAEVSLRVLISQTILPSSANINRLA